MELSEAVRARRMVRSFTGAPIPTPTLERLLAAACTGPSAGNTGGWDAVVLAGEAQTSVFWDATTTDGWRARSRRWPGLRRAAAAVAFFVDPAAYAARYRLPDKAAGGLGSVDAWPVPYWFVDGGFAALLLLLAATDAGLGACFLGNFRGEEDLREALGVPGDRRYAGAVVLGVPDPGDPPSPSSARGPRRPDEVLHFGGW